MDARQEASFIKKLDKAGYRKEEILLLVEHGWSYKEVGQALEISRGLISGVVDRWKRKQKTESHA